MSYKPTLIMPLGSWSTIPALLLKLKEAGVEIDRVRIIATDNKNIETDCKSISTSINKISPKTTIEVFIAKHISDIRTQQDALQMRSAILFAAAGIANNEMNYFCLSGGRKSMSSDLQFAASYFGAHKIIHLLLPNSLDDLNCYEKFKTSLLEGNQNYYNQFISDFTLVEIPPLNRHAGFQLKQEEFKKVLLRCESEINVKKSTQNLVVADIENNNSELHELVLQTLKDSSNLALNFHKSTPSPWNSMYLLPPDSLKLLNRIRITDREKSVEYLLSKFPKAELHCHIGGILSLSSQIKVGTSLWNKMSSEEKICATNWIKNEKELIIRLNNSDDNVHSSTPLKTLLSKADKIRPLVTATLLSQFNEEQLKNLLWNPKINRFALGINNNFFLYEEPGELAGSAILKDRRCISAYTHEIILFCVKHNLKILELRCSPAKYISESDNGFSNQYEFIECLKRGFQDACLSLPSQALKPRISIILICDRRKPDSFSGTINTLLSIQNNEDLRRFVVGIDVAGDEIISMTADQISAELTKVREHSIHTTVHAGETVSGGAVWNAVHRFSADRVGHALTLLNDRENGENLVRKVNDRRITIELCPSSNREVVGYHFSDEVPAQSNPYPLREYLKRNIKVAICTDNPGISNTTPENEFVVASRLLNEPLSIFECLQLIKNSFTGSFLPKDELETIISDADNEIFEILQLESESLINKNLT